MDFALSDEQQAITDLAAQILTDMCAPERLREVESGSDWFHRDLWAELAKADLLGVALPEADGGGGYGFLEACLLLQEAGRAVAPIPLYATLVLGALPIATFGTEAQRQRYLPGVIAGDTILTGAIAELTAGPYEPQLEARPAAGGGYTLHGVKTRVPAFHLAAACLVTARGPEGPLVLIVPTDAAGLSAARQDTFNHEPQFHLDFDGVAVDADAVLGPDGDAALGWLVERAVAGLCALAAGVSDRGMRITAEYVTNRKQFDRPVGSFQAVGHRMADCFVDNEAVRLSMLQAATRLASAEAGESVAREVAVAKYWAAVGGSRVGHADLHLHGGISIDLDYPIHRYFLWAKHIEFSLGSGTEQLANLGAMLAAEPLPA